MDNQKKTTQAQPKQGGRGRTPCLRSQYQPILQPLSGAQQQREVQWPQSSQGQQQKPGQQQRPQSSQEQRQSLQQQRPQSSQGQQQNPAQQQRPQSSQEQQQSLQQQRPQSSQVQLQPAQQRRPQSSQEQRQSLQQQRPQASQGQQQNPAQQQRPQSSQEQRQSLQQQRPQSSQGQLQPAQQRRPQSSQEQRQSLQQQRPQASQGQQQNPAQQQRPQSSQEQRQSLQQQRPQSSQGQQHLQPAQKQRPQSSQGQQQTCQQQLRSPEQQRPQTSPGQLLPREMVRTPETRQLQTSPSSAANVTSKPSQSFSPTIAGRGEGDNKSTSIGFCIPKRKDRPLVQKKGGKPIVVETNHLALKIKNTKTVVFHYDVSVIPERPFRFYRPALNAVQKKCYPDRHPAFDGKKNLYAFPELPILKKELVETVEVYDDEREVYKEITVTIKFAASVDMSVILDYIKGGSSLKAPQDAIQALDVVLRQPAANRCVTIGRSFFTKPPGQVISLGDGLDLWYGFFQSAIIGWKPYLNIDVAHKGFPSPATCLQLLAQICECDITKLEQTNFALQHYQKEKFQDHMKNLKVIEEIPKHSIRRTYKVMGLSECPRKNNFSTEDKNTGKKTTLSVEEYFLKNYNFRLRFPHLPCLVAGSRDKPVSLPMELCRIMEGQVTMKSLNENQIKKMVKVAAVDTESRKRKIVASMRNIAFNEDPCIKEFGLSVSDNFTQVDARILAAPTVDYRDRSNAPTSERVNKGVWRINDNKFIFAAEISRWVILNTNKKVRDDELKKFTSGLIQFGREAGINIPLETPQITFLEQPSRIEDYFRLCQKNDVKLIVVVLSERGVSYAAIKKMAELHVGVLTQCLKSVTVQKKCNQSTLVNILLKINAKLNGVNHYITPHLWPDFFKRPIMVVGADVTHPPPDKLFDPSIAAVAASHDPRAFKYNMMWKLQPPRVEVIADLQKIMVEQLLYFYRSTRLRPERILFYRDGVSEGQFQVILDVELRAIRAACHSLSPEYQPAISFFVVQKRHHTRFFPSDIDADGKNKNVPAGTIVDREITHPTEIDFFLVSHASIQGTARPTKYHLLWDDADMSEKEIEEVTYYLCHLFTRCTRSVSYPAPTYYAHLACSRARSYTNTEGGRRLNTDNLDAEQSQRQIKEVIVKNNPMFFV